MVHRQLGVVWSKSDFDLLRVGVLVFAVLIDDFCGHVALDPSCSVEGTSDRAFAISQNEDVRALRVTGLMCRQLSAVNFYTGNTTQRVQD